MEDRKTYTTNTKWEKQVGYSRAVKVGNIIEVSGTTAMKDGKVVGEKDACKQAKYIFQEIEKALIALGSGLQDVIRTRMYVTDISNWEEIGRAHSEVFKDIAPAATMVEVKALIHPDLLVEVEVTAVTKK